MGGGGGSGMGRAWVGILPFSEKMSPIPPFWKGNPAPWCFFWKLMSRRSRGTNERSEY